MRNESPIDGAAPGPGYQKYYHLLLNPFRLSNTSPWGYPAVHRKGPLYYLVLLMWTGKAGIELSMHVCVAQVTAGRIDWSANEQKSVS